MENRRSPANAAFIEALEEQADFAQVRIQRIGTAFELRHVADRECPADSLASVPFNQLRALAQDTADGAFRPLKSAPNLRTGWRFDARDEDQMTGAIDLLYPGGITDWHSRNEPDHVTSYKRHTDRQTGMYRITAMLDKGSAESVFAACCAPRFCLKNRRWSYDGAVSVPASEWDLPCLEPCAVLMEFARKAVRITQEPTADLPFSVSELDTLLASLSDDPITEPTREADFADPRNSRRRALLDQRLRDAREGIREQPQQ
jgi:hypothetical protein